VVGASGFEPPASWSRTRRSTRLSHAPTDCGDPQFNIRSFYFPVCRVSQSVIMSSAPVENVSSKAPYSLGAQVLQC
jgi:hypothetical protein